MNYDIVCADFKLENVLEIARTIQAIELKIKRIEQQTVAATPAGAQWSKTIKN